MTRLKRVQELLDYVCGCDERADARPPLTIPDWAWGLWWACLTLGTLVFCGQSSKFIYIDF